MVLLAVEVDLLGVEGMSGSSEAEDAEASPTEGEMWKEAARIVALEPGHDGRMQKRGEAGVMEDLP